MDFPKSSGKKFGELWGVSAVGYFLMFSILWAVQWGSVWIPADTIPPADTLFWITFRAAGQDVFGITMKPLVAGLFPAASITVYTAVRGVRE